MLVHQPEVAEMLREQAADNRDRLASQWRLSWYYSGEHSCTASAREHVKSKTYAANKQQRGATPSHPRRGAAVVPAASCGRVFIVRLACGRLLRHITASRLSALVADLMSDVAQTSCISVPATVASLAAALGESGHEATRLLRRRHGLSHP